MHPSWSCSFRLHDCAVHELHLNLTLQSTLATELHAPVVVTVCVEALLAIIPTLPWLIDLILPRVLSAEGYRLLLGVEEHGCPAHVLKRIGCGSPAR